MPKEPIIPTQHCHLTLHSGIYSLDEPLSFFGAIACDMYESPYSFRVFEVPKARWWSNYDGISAYISGADLLSTLTEFLLIPISKWTIETENTFPWLQGQPSFPLRILPLTLIFCYRLAPCILPWPSMPFFIRYFQRCWCQIPSNVGKHLEQCHFLLAYRSFQENSQ